MGSETKSKERIENSPHHTLQRQDLVGVQRATALMEMLLLIYKYSIYNTRKANYFSLTLTLIFTFKFFLYFVPLTFLAS